MGWNSSHWYASYWFRADWYGPNAGVTDRFWRVRHMGLGLGLIYPPPPVPKLA